LHAARGHRVRIGDMAVAHLEGLLGGLDDGVQIGQAVGLGDAMA
jgi:hypothetical protein